MGDTHRDPEFDRARPDPRAEGERVTGASSQAAEAADGGTPPPPEPSGAADTIGRTGTQDKTAQ